MMNDVTYEPVSRSSHIFDVVVNGRVVGVVWRKGGRWHASAVSMADERIRAEARDLAAEALIRGNSTQI